MENKDITKRLSWLYIGKGHCAFRRTVNQDRGCMHEFAVTPFCRFATCPIVQDNLVLFDREEDILYMIEKTGIKTKEIKLEGSFEDIEKQVERKIKALPAKAQEPARIRFEQLKQIAISIRKESELLAEDE